MKKHLLFAAFGLLMAGTANAQWTEEGVCFWTGEISNYGREIKTNADGITYAYFFGVDTGGYPQYVVVMDKEGNLLTEGNGLLLSQEANKSWTVINNYMGIDAYGNAFVAVLDQRTGLGESYTVYKVGPDGKLIWGDKTLNNGLPAAPDCAGMSMCPTSDGGAIFAYMGMTYESDVPSFINIEKLNKDGNSVWRQQLKDPDKLLSYTYPYLVDAGDNQAVLFYMEGAGYTTKARLLDFDGSNAWDEDVVVWRGGYGSMPPHVQVAAGKGPDGAAFAWQSGSKTTDCYENRLCYILKDDGSYAFSDGEGGTVISNDDVLSRRVPDFYWDESDQAFYCFFGEYDQAYQSYRGLYMQKMSDEGELLWGPNGIEVAEIAADQQYQGMAVRDAGDGQVAVFYQHMDGWYAFGDVETLMTLYDKDGNIVREAVDLTPWPGTKSDLYVSDLIDGEYYIVSWSEDDPENEYHERYYAKRVNLNGEPLEPSAIDQHLSPITHHPSPIYDLQGRRMADNAAAVESGVYVKDGKKYVVK